MIQVGLIILALGVVLFILISALSRAPKLDQAYYEKKWQAISPLAEGGPSDWYRAIIDADKLLDNALKNAKYRGKTMGDRLKNANDLRSINHAWTAHKLRNRLVHEPNVQLQERIVKAALNSYKQILTELGALK